MGMLWDEDIEETMELAIIFLNCTCCLRIKEQDLIIPPLPCLDVPVEGVANSTIAVHSYSGEHNEMSSESTTSIEMFRKKQATTMNQRHVSMSDKRLELPTVAVDMVTTKSKRRGDKARTTVR